MDRINHFIAYIYRSMQFRGTEGFRAAAMRSLGVLVPFDGALWGSGNFETPTFHSAVVLGVRDDYPQPLERSAGENPILPALIDNIGTAVDMASIISDDEFYASHIYKHYFSRYGIERILSYIDLDKHRNIYTLISLYRFDRDQMFTEAERALFEQAAYHMIHAARHAFFVHIASMTNTSQETSAAICDGHGLFYQAMPEFLDMLEQHLSDWQGDRLPFELPPPGQRLSFEGLCVETEPFGDLFTVHLWEERPTDMLGQRDRRIVNGVCKGMTFKEIARDLQLAPSTVSNRLYRIYRKLGVTSRAALARLVYSE